MTYGKPVVTFSGNSAYSIVVVDQLNPDGTTLLAREKHYFNGNPTTISQDAISYPSWLTGREYQTEAIDTANCTPTTCANVLQRIFNYWQQRAPVSWWTGSSDAAPPSDPRIYQTDTTLLDTNQVSRKVYLYDDSLPFNNQSDVYEYDYGAPPYATRHTHTDYLKINPVNGIDYTNTNIHLRSLSSGQNVYAVNPQNGAETLMARSTVTYDQGTTYDCANIVGHDSSFSTSYATRGNVTGTTVYTDAAGATGPLTTSVAYDIAGNPVQRTDPKGNVSSLSYSDAFTENVNRYTYAFVTHTTSPVPDPTNIYGSNTALETSGVFDYSTGLIYSSTDANTRTITFQYNDPLDRLTSVTRPDTDAYWNHGTTTYSYGNTIGNIYVRTQVRQNISQTTDSYQYFDGLGRAFHSSQYVNSDPNNPWLSVDTQYDASGRTWKVSNPYMTTSSSNGVGSQWTTTLYDALSRVSSVTTPDNAVMSNSYSGNAVTVTDQQYRTRKSVTDALGRLVQLTEDVGTGHLNYQTNYTYDALGNLRQVSQGTQVRYFMYDSVSRLIRAKNPEQSVNSGLALTDPVTDNTSWSFSYSYDANGNVSTRTDARGVTTTYTYDNLNRNTKVRYTSDPTNTPGVNRYYDGAYNGRGRLYWSETLGNGEISGEGASTIGVTYDVMGRITQLRRTYYLGGGSWSGLYTTDLSYDLAGHTQTQTYPSGHTVSYSYDAAGRTQSLTGNLGDGAQRNYSTEIGYNEWGMKQEKLGTQTPIYNKHLYNVRGQLSEIRESTTPNDTSWNRGAIINQYAANC